MTNLSTLYRQNVVGVQWVGIATDTTASTLSGYLINASLNNVTLTLPLNPTEGDVVGVCDAYNQAENYVITVARNSENIESVAEDLIVNVPGSGMILVYVDSTVGWKIVSEIGSSEGLVSDAVYAAGWDGIVDVAPSKNAVYDKINGMGVALDPIWAAAGDLVQGTGNDAGEVLSLGAANLKAFVNAGATAIEWAGGIKIGTFSNAQDGATGAVATTGVGFKPTAVIFIANINNQTGRSIGFDDGTLHYCSSEATNGTNRSFAIASIQLLDNASWSRSATITSMGADGFTLTWTNGGTPPGGTVDVFYIALR